MSDHVGEALVDLLADRCAPERRRLIEDHLSECDACAAKLEWLQRVRDDAIRESLGHLSAMRLVSLGASRETSTPLEREHLESCEDCAQELSWLRRLPEAEELVEGPDPVPGSARSRRSWRSWAWAGLATAAAAALLFVLLPGGAPDLAGLARIEPLPVEITRGPAEPDSFEAALVRGLTLYQQGEFTDARDELQDAVALREDETASLYLASTELLLGDVEPATVRLRETADRAVDPFVREELLWQLANGELFRGRGEEAERILQQLIELAGYRAAEAEELLAEITAID